MRDVVYMKIDVFDFDGTLYKKDASKEFFLFCLNKKKMLIKYIPGILLNFLLYYLKLIKKEKLKEYYFKFLRDFSNIDEMVSLFWEQNKNLIRRELLENSKNEKVVISASPSFLIEDICLEIGIDTLIATDVDKKTGKFNSSNCYGEEKIKRLNEKYKDYKIDRFYSDSKSDLPLARIAKKPYFIIHDREEEWNLE